MATDTAAAQAFYSAVLGWGTQRMEGPMDYTMATVDGVPTSGYMALPDEVRAQGAPPHWLTYVGVPDVDAHVAEATAAGATACVAPRDIPDVGRFAVLFDPQGALYAVYTPLRPEPETPGMAPVGHASWHELVTRDSAAARAYYAAMFGWEATSDFDMGEMGTYRLFGRGGQELGGMFDLSPAMEGVPPNWLPYFRVSDLDAAVGRVTANGGKIVNGPMEVPGGDRVAQCFDAQGGAFALHEAKGQG
jgi:predicted enzyme related to lactoylglutathione lyase